MLRPLPLVLVALVAACGGGGGDSEAAGEVASCRIEDGLPVAEVDVTNTTGTAASFAVTVRFANDGRVLGQGEEWTTVLRPGDTQRVSMGNQGGDALHVSDCEILSVSPR